jgi:hypothetical protein
MNPKIDLRFRSQIGNSIIELAVAMTVLAAGSAVLWYGLRSSARLDKMNRLHHIALYAARSDMESLRLLPKASVHDTEYALILPGGDPMRLVRQVFDSSDMVNSLEEISLDEKLSPVELRKPLEVKVSVLLKSISGSESSWEGLKPWGEPSADLEPSERALVTLLMKLPEYRWY